NVTILSGEINDPNALGDNSRTILTAYNVDANALVDGFVFQRGYCEDGSPAAQDATAMGAAIFMVNSHFTINRCVFEHNRARGGAAIGALDSSPKVMNCT